MNLTAQKLFRFFLFSIFIYSLIFVTSSLIEVSVSTSAPVVLEKIYLADPIYEVLSMTAVQSRRIKNEKTRKWSFHPQNESLEACPILPPDLKGTYFPDLSVLEWTEIEAKFNWLENGGHSKPKDCLAQHRVAIIIPYRNREIHLKVLVNNLHDFLRRQQLDYSLIVVEPIANQTFNRAKLMNIGYMEAMKAYPFECFIFHDVDLYPEDDRMLYSCPVRPRHMSVAIDIFNYKLPVEWNFGGVTALSVDHMRRMNGFSNDFWGWGGEDDDLFKRVKYAGYNYSRYPASVARFTMFKHKKMADKGNEQNKCVWPLLNNAETRWQASGLSNLNYKVENTTLYKLYMHVIVDLLEEESRLDLAKYVQC